MIPRPEGRGIALFYPWKIRALVPPNGARGLCRTKADTLARTEGAIECRVRAMDLIRFNAHSGMKVLSIVVESIWTGDGNTPDPEALPSYDAATTPNPTPISTPRNRRSQQQTSSYFDERALFWEAFTERHICQRPNHCHDNAWRGLACLEYEGRTAASRTRRLEIPFENDRDCGKSLPGRSWCLVDLAHGLGKHCHRVARQSPSIC
jgi:hypothetical protein